VLEVPVTFFYNFDPVRAPAISADFAELTAGSAEDDLLRRAETLELVSAYFTIEDAMARRRLFDLAKTLAGEGEARRSG
jgi:hypothetical protein